MTGEEPRHPRFAHWLTGQLRQRDWSQGKLIVQSGSTDDERLSSAAVSRYSTGKMLPDIGSCQKIARALGLPIELVLREAGLLDLLPHETDWVQRIVDELAYAVAAGQLSEEGRMAIMTQLRREQRLQALERQVISDETANDAAPPTTTG
jgi:transcriptional regulator with XRE-family HTH domain